MLRVIVAAGLLALLFAGASEAQLTPVTFPDTPVGTTSTVKCPTNTVGICFGTNCSGSGTIQGISGPSLPFKITNLNVLTPSQFNSGACVANPTSLPVTVGAGQILAFQATFSPTSVNSFSGSATFSTSGGPATLGLNGKGVSSSPGRKDKGFISLQLSSDGIVPGSGLTIRYQTARNTLQGNADIYFVIALPSGQLLFVNEQGGMVPAIQPFRHNVNVGDSNQTVFSGPFPTDASFGTYTFYMGMAYAGTTPDLNNLAPSLASGIAQATVAYTPLSAQQQSLISSRGNPDFISVIVAGDPPQKQESWLYLSSPATQILFVNGAQQSQATVPSGPGGPKVDPSLFTPQTTLGQLTSALGAPTSVTPVDGAPGFQTVVFKNVGLTVILNANGRLGTAFTAP